MLSLEEYRKLANDEIAAIPYPATPNGLYEPIAYTMDLGGKRLRPALVLMACEAMGGDVKKAIKPAVGLELFHNFTLLHDDVMDNADVRRGKPTVHRRWNDNTAILSGDAMLTMSSQYVAQVEPAVLPEIMRLFNQTAMEIYEGQQYDMDFEVRNNVTLEEYIDMIRLKTSVLIGCACKMGALIAGASEANAQALYETGLYLGLAFQLQDDVLDVWGDEATFGKAIGGDITSNKKTYMLINAFNRANDEQRAELMRWVEATEFDRAEKVAAVTRLYNEIGIDRLAQQKIEYFFAESRKYLAKVSVAEERKAELAAYAERMMKRKY